MDHQKTLREKFTPYLLFSVLVAALGGFLFGYHTAVISGALIFLTTDFHLSITSQGVVVSMILVGCIAGALIASTLTDKWGRKGALMISSIVFVIGAIFLSLCESVSCLVLGRIISGIAVGVTSVAAPLYISEISPRRHRGMFVSAYQLAITLGILTSFIVDYGFAAVGDWRYMFLLGAAPALVQFVSLVFLSDTPAWLFKVRRQTEATNVLKRLRYGKNWMNQIESIKKVADPRSTGTWKTLFSSKLRFVVFVGLFLSIFQQITGINTVIYYAPTIFQYAGFSSATGAIGATIGVGIINVLATVVAMWLLDRWGRRTLLLLGSAGMALSLLVLGLAFLLQLHWTDQTALVSLMAYVSFFAIGLGPVTWVLISEIYPMKIRSKAMTLATFANWGFNYLVSLTFLDLIRRMGAGSTFLLYAVVTLVCFWFVYRFIPETKGKSLEEIESMILR